MIAEGGKSELEDALQDAASEVMARAGERVRAARERKGIPRRILAQRSGVSARYLAQLESGEGNISIALLTRVAHALDHRLEWLISEDDPWGSDILRLVRLFQAADAQTQENVLRALSVDASEMQRAERICLVGLRGAGKSTLGQRASEALSMPFVELNKEIERSAGMAASEIMALYGPEGFRKLEADSLERVIASHDRVMLAVAGGIVAEPATYSRLLAGFHTIWIKASPEDHMLRVRAQGDERPMAGNPEAMLQLRGILRAREALYDRAHAQVDTSGKSVEAALDLLVAIIQTRGFARSVKTQRSITG
ncbi:helix-turn-helix transcriptional regulator [Thalassococcus lentus]|uniref:Shikimate kinase n=1 Tax=Thalassococcus lentus TaxID=1210524 RepID=A0ABT4XVS5_9RHOB|nr:helix-turn-helix transcriptional regulator [Thalassococcus lentus]MDA7426033.1 helix-turn-helix transcriptional regulator [Thalassococcus lentus]